ncbi:MAG: peptidoglycan editing factor PgeF [Pseudomonadota bacterium]
MSVKASSINNPSWKWSEQWPECIEPLGLAPSIRACITSRDALHVNGTANFSLFVNEDPKLVHVRREQLAQILTQPIYWLSKQVHGTHVVDFSNTNRSPTTCISPHEYRFDEPADAVWTNRTNSIIGVLTADCLPILLWNHQGTHIAAIHAGWRGLQAGIIKNTIDSFDINADELNAWIGPAIGSQAFQVGYDVYDSFCSQTPEATIAFHPDLKHPDKWLADLNLLATMHLNAAGINNVTSSGICTSQDSAKWFSYRSNSQSGRFASLIWIEQR